MTEVTLIIVIAYVAWVWGGISQVRHESNRDGYLSLPEVCNELLRRGRVKLASLF